MKTIQDKEFRQYGVIIDTVDCSGLLSTLRDSTPQPASRTVYAPYDTALEGLPVFGDLQDRIYGGNAIQIGYCNGYNTKLNCLEYHRGPEVIIPTDEIILMLARLQCVADGTLDTSLVELFRVPAQTAVLLYETSLHYSPAHSEHGFRVAIVLPRYTNTTIPEITLRSVEDRMLRARNKWLLAHSESAEAKDGAHIGLIGGNIDLLEL